MYWACTRRARFVKLEKGRKTSLAWYRRGGVTAYHLEPASEKGGCVLTLFKARMTSQSVCAKEKRYFIIFHISPFGQINENISTYISLWSPHTAFTYDRTLTYTFAAVCGVNHTDSHCLISINYVIIIFTLVTYWCSPSVELTRTSAYTVTENDNNERGHMKAFTRKIRCSASVERTVNTLTYMIIIQFRPCSVQSVQHSPSVIPSDRFDQCERICKVSLQTQNNLAMYRSSSFRTFP